MNEINVIAPYKHHGMWVFDDPRVGLVQEPFVAGADVILDQVTADIPNASKGVTLVFSGLPFPGSTHTFVWVRQQGAGNVYHSEELKLEGWLCPALLRYFDRPPREIHMQVKRLLKP